MQCVNCHHGINRTIRKEIEPPRVGFAALNAVLGAVLLREVAVGDIYTDDVLAVICRQKRCQLTGAAAEVHDLTGIVQCGRNPCPNVIGDLLVAIVRYMQTVNLVVLPEH